MIVLQALAAWLSRSIGRFFQAAFGWAVVALFGPRPKREKTVLSAAVAAAAAWPVLLIGILFPRVATFVLAFVPLSREIDSGVLRVAWAAAALAVPVGIGLLLGKHAAERGDASVWRKIAHGFPATLGVACAFVFVAIAAPLRKLVALVRRRVATHVPVIVSIEAYEELATVVEDVFASRGPGALAQPRSLRGGSARPRAARRSAARSSGGSFPRVSSHFAGTRSRSASARTASPCAGPSTSVTRVRGLLAEALTFSLALQTLDAEAQKLEKRLKALVVGGPRRGAPVRSTDSLDRIAQRLLGADIPEEDWQVLHRELLQAACAREGQEPLLMGSVAHSGGAVAGRASPGRRSSPSRSSP